jgi:hypothetical protein
MLAAWLKISRNPATVLELIQSHFGRWRPLPENAGEIQNARPYRGRIFITPQFWPARVTAIEPAGRASKPAPIRKTLRGQYDQSTQGRLRGAAIFSNAVGSLDRRKLSPIDWPS